MNSDVPIFVALILGVLAAGVAAVFMATAIVDECNTFGAFSFGPRVYECKLREEK